MTTTAKAKNVSEDRPLRVGVWMPLPPGTKLRGEGLMRLLDFVSAGFPQANARFVIVTPTWMRDEFEDEFKEMTEAQRAIYELRTPRTLFSAIYEPINRWQQRRNSVDYKIDKLARRRPSWFKPMASMVVAHARKRPTLLAGLVALGALIGLGVLAAFPMATLMTFAALILTFVVYVGFVMLRAAASSGGMVGRLVGLVIALIQSPWRTVRDIANRTTRKVVAFKDMLLDSDLRLQAEVASRDTDIDCWFTMHVTADSARFLKGPKVALFADFVFFDCPPMGSRDWLRRAKAKARRLVRHVDAVITLAEHVRENQLYRYFPAARNAHVAIVDHAPIDLSVDLPGGIGAHALPDVPLAKTPETRRICGDAIRGHIRTQLRKETQRRLFRMAIYSPIYEHQYRYLDGFPIEDTRFIFVSTQIRPYKNIINLIKATEILIRRRGMNIKLVLSGSYQPGQDVYEYVRDNGLYYDVWSVPRLPRPAHAAMYHCAELTVHPTFFEGGQGAFPLTESLSVGTPVLLSRHPGTVADADSEIYRDMLFDPYAVEEIADRLQEALGTAPALLARQHEILRERLEWRSWTDVSREYIDVFRIAIDRHRARDQANQ